MTSTDKRLTIPEGNDTFSDEDYATSTERTKAARTSALEDPAVAKVVDEKLDKIRHRVETLSALRKARGLTQIQLSEELGLTQGEISRLERRENLHLATLARFIEATGGKLRIVATYNGEEVEVAIGELTETATAGNSNARVALSG